MRGRPVDALLANAGHGLGNGFLDQDFDEIRARDRHQHHRHGLPVQQVGAGMRERGEGRILVTGSIAGFMPGTFQAVYNGTKAFIDSFSLALRNELKDTRRHGDLPDARRRPTPQFFERADMLDTKVGTDKKEDPADVAKVGFKAMLEGEGDVVAGWKNKLQAVVANVTPS